MRTMLIVAAFALSACTPSLKERVSDLKLERCANVLSGYDELRSAPGYAEERYGPRFDLEMEAARCWLVWRQPEKAKQVVHDMEGADESSEGLMILARAHAQLVEDDELRPTLDALSRRTGVHVPFYWEHPELRRYAHTDWYVTAALRTWSHATVEPLERVVSQLARAAGSEILALSVASADSQRAAGEWVVWTGMVRDTKLDRGRNKTVLLVQGMTKEKRLSGFRGEETVQKDFTGGLTRKVDVQGTYSEELVPTGQSFVVEQDGIDEGAVGLQAVTVVGRYSGRAGDDLPLVRPLTLMDLRKRDLR